MIWPYPALNRKPPLLSETKVVGAVTKIIEDKKDYWKYVLYYEVLAQNFAWLDGFSRFRDRTDYPRIPNGHGKIDDAGKMTDLMLEQLHFLEKLMTDVPAIFEEYEGRAFGYGEAEPDPVYILKIADSLIGKYKSLVWWMINMRRYQLSPDYTEGFREFIRFGDDYARTFDTLREQARTFPKKVYQYYRGEIREDEIPTDMGLNITLDTDRTKKIFAALGVNR